MKWMCHIVEDTNSMCLILPSNKDEGGKSHEAHLPKASNAHFHCFATGRVFATICIYTYPPGNDHISHLGKLNITLKHTLNGDMIDPSRVYQQHFLNVQLRSSNSWRLRWMMKPLTYIQCLYRYMYIYICYDSFLYLHIYICILHAIVCMSYNIYIYILMYTLCMIFNISKQRPLSMWRDVGRFQTIMSRVPQNGLLCSYRVAL